MTDFDAVFFYNFHISVVYDYKGYVCNEMAFY